MADNLREQILNIISKNGRYSTKEIAAMLGSDENTVENEIKQMEDENVILEPNNVIKDSIISKNVIVRSSYVSNSRISENVIVGPFETVIDKNV